MINSAVTKKIFYCITCPNCHSSNGLCFENEPRVSETFAGYCVHCQTFVSGYMEKDQVAKIGLVDTESKNRFSKVGTPQLFFLKSLKDIYF